MVLIACGHRYSASPLRSHLLERRPVPWRLGHAAYGKVGEGGRAVYGKLRALVVLYDSREELRYKAKGCTRGHGKEGWEKQGIAQSCTASFVMCRLLVRRVLLVSVLLDYVCSVRQADRGTPRAHLPSSSGPPGRPGAWPCRHWNIHQPARLAGAQSTCYSAPTST